MRAHFGLPTVEAEDTEGKPPIQVKFEIPYFTVSGIQVRTEINLRKCEVELKFLYFLILGPTGPSE